jgi:hypothetical protein
VTRGLTFHQLMVGLLVGAIAATACLMPAQADSYWHLRAGQEIWRTLHVPLDEHYSYTAAGRPWPNHEWLWQAFSYALFRAGGMPLLVAGGAAVVMAAFGIAYRLMVGPTATRFLLMLLGLPIASCVWALRPQIVSLMLLALLLHLIVSERYLLLPPLFVLWANAHGAVALGGAVLAAATLAAALRARGGDASDHRRALRLAALLPVCALATTVTPMGFGLWRFIRESMTLSRQTRINEWLPAYPTGPVEIAFWALALAFLVLLARRRRRLRGAPFADVVLVAAAVAILPLAFRAVRNIPPFLLVAMPAASRLLGREFRLRRAGAGERAGADRVRLNLALLVGISCLEAAGVIAAWATSIPRLGWQPVSPGALAAVRAAPAPVYNRYNEGGFLIWFAPERPVFLDSRQDPYPLPFLLEALRLENDAPYRPMFQRWGIRSAFLPADSTLVARLRGDGWRSRFADDKWVVLVAPGAG